MGFKYKNIMMMLIESNLMVQIVDYLNFLIFKVRRKVVFFIKEII